MGILLSKDYEYIEIKEKSVAASTSIWSAVIFLALVFILILALFRKGPTGDDTSSGESRIYKRIAEVEMQMNDSYAAERQPNPHFISSGLDSPLLIPQK